MPSIDVLVVGAGLYGLTTAERFAARGLHVALIDRRGHIGGNAHSYLDGATQIEVHQYGSHIFHTSNEKVWEYVNRFTAFTPYEHRVFTRHQGQVYPLPVNLSTIAQLWGHAMSPSEARALIARDAEPYHDQTEASLERKALGSIGPRLYEAFFRDYTQKQWQTPPSLLPASVISRLPVRYNFDSRYFEDSYQGLPRDGYFRWFERMVDHPLIDVFLENDFFDPTSVFFKDKSVGQIPVVYTGPLDRYFDYRAGILGWRTLDFEWSQLDIADYQGTAVMNYADADIPYTRVHEFKHFAPHASSGMQGTIVAREFSRRALVGDDPYYPVGTPEDRLALQKYRDLAADETGVQFGGRLGTYKYLDMHMAIASALQAFEIADRL